MNRKEREKCYQIYEKYKKFVNWYLWKYFPEIEKEDRYDIMQDVWRILIENIKTVGTWSESSQGDWLMRVCKNRAISFKRKAEREINWDIEEDGRVYLSMQLVSVEDEAINRVMAESVLAQLTLEDKSNLFWKMFSSARGSKNNAENCKRYRFRQKLKSIMKEGGWDS